MEISGRHFESIADLKNRRLAYLTGESFSGEVDDCADVIIHRITDFS